jgi:DNA-directed RNA polymerase specialized sigma24 family protein
MERRIKRRDALAEIERMALTLGPMTEALLHVVDPGIDAPLVSARKNPRQGRASEVLEAIASLSPDERRIVLAELMEVAA